MSAEAAFNVLEQAIARGPIPGAAAAVNDQCACFGVLEPDGPAVTSQTWYDLASLTKVLVTVPLCLDAIASGQLDPMAPLRDVLPEVAWLQPAPNLGDATIAQLASHSSGLPAWQPLYTLGLERQTHFARLVHTPLDHPPGAVTYSDLGFLILGHVLERLYEQPLDALARGLFERLGIGGMLGYGPPPEAAVAPTERCPWRKRLLRGEVHDENAAALGGVAGHAGLFGTLEGVNAYARALLDGRLHAPAVLDYAASEHARGEGEGGGGRDGSRRGFGWVLMSRGWSGGDFMSPHSIGHTGFTGTGLWIDLERGRSSVLLTNRVHPSRHIPSGIERVRRAFNHAAAGS